MKVYFHDDFYTQYTHDPAAAAGRMEAVTETIAPYVEITPMEPAAAADLQAVHPQGHLDTIRSQGLYDRSAYLDQVERALADTTADVIAVSAGFDNHIDDWGGLLLTDDYQAMGAWVRQAAKRNGGGCFGILEGGYNHEVLGKNVLAFLKGIGEF